MRADSLLAEAPYPHSTEGPRLSDVTISKKLFRNELYGANGSNIGLNFATFGSIHSLTTLHCRSKMVTICTNQNDPRASNLQKVKQVYNK